MSGYGYGSGKRPDPPRRPLGSDAESRLHVPPRFEGRRTADASRRAVQGLAGDGDLSGNIDGDTEVQGGSLYVEATQTVRVGVTATADAIEKTLRLHGSAFVANPTPSGGPGLNYSVYVYQAAAAGVSVTGQAVVFLPRGTVITGIRARGYRQTASDQFELLLWRIDDLAMRTGLATLTHATTGWSTVEDLTLNETVGIDAYMLHVTLKGSADVIDARLLWVEFVYEMPSYDKTV